MSKGMGKAQRAVLELVGNAWWDNENFVLVSELYNALRREYHAASIARALHGLIQAGKLVRHGEAVYLPDNLRRMERDEIIEHDTALGLPWWDRKIFQKS